MDKNIKCYGIFLDLSKAFDTVSIPTLISKLERIGIRGQALQIYKNYLLDRSQSTRIGADESDEHVVDCGIPQGSILGPSLFLVYINELCNLKLPNCDIFAYADDTALLAYGVDWESAKRNAEYGLQKVMNWLSLNWLTLNVEKSKFVRFYIPNSPVPPVTTNVLKAHCCADPGNCDCFSISQVKYIKYLGVLVDERLDWRPHILSLSSRIRKLMAIFKNLRHIADPSLLRTIYTVLCQSVICYCITVWGGTYKTLFLGLERAQRAVLKVINFKPRLYSTNLLYEECQVLTVRKLYILRTIMRKHCGLPLENEFLRKRSGSAILPSVRSRTVFASRQYDALGSKLYNRINNRLSIYHLNIHDVKYKLTNWLLTLNYVQTESLLSSCYFT